MLTKIAVCIAMGAKLLALSCSNPVTIAQYEHTKHADEKIHNFQLKVNEKGDLTSFWCTKEALGSALQIAHKWKGEEWTSPAIITRAADFNWLTTHLSAQREMYVAWRVGSNFGDIKSHPICYARRTGEGHWYINSQVFNRSEGIYFQNMVMDKEGKLFLSGLTSNFVLDLIEAQPKHPQEDPLFQQFFKNEGYFAKVETAVGAKGTACATWLTIEENPQTKIDHCFLECSLKRVDFPWSEPEKVYVAAFPLNDSYGKISSIKTVIDSQGNPTIIWTVRESANLIKIQAISRVDGSWVGPIDLCAPTEWIYSLEAAIDDQDNILAVWKEYHVQKGGKKSVICGAYKPCQENWTPPVIISDPKIDSCDPVLAHDHRGTFVVAWMSGFGRPGRVYGSSFSKKYSAWSMPALLTPEGSLGLSPVLAFSENGEGYMAWLDCSDQRKIQVAQLQIKNNGN